jgi:hypothetical protein
LREPVGKFSSPHLLNEQHLKIQACGAAVRLKLMGKRRRYGVPASAGKASNCKEVENMMRAEN